MKIVAALYIEDMGSGNTRTESIDIESKLNNKNYPDWISDCANFVSQCLDAGKKVIENVVSNISDSRNWFSYGSKLNYFKKMCS